VEYGLFSGFFMNKFACRKEMPIDIFLIFCHDILAMILFRILTKSEGVQIPQISRIFGLPNLLLAMYMFIIFERNYHRKLLQKIGYNVSFTVLKL
jgi:hypothetical protein